jgi:hypothetical protein
MKIKTIDDIKDEYENLILDVENLIDAIIQKYRQEVESEINSVCVQAIDDDNPTKLEFIVVTPKDAKWFEERRGKSCFSDRTRPSRIIAENLRKMMGVETEEFIIRTIPNFYFHKRYDGE